jgi:hypothetical protein
MKRLVYSSLIASFFIVLAGHRTIAQSPTNRFQTGLNSAKIFTVLGETTTIKVSQATSKLDEEAAFNLVWKLPIVQRKAREIARLSKGTIRVAATVDSSPTPEEPYYTVRVFENHVDHIDTIYWFRVLSPSGEIQVLDLVLNEYISLKEWKPN